MTARENTLRAYRFQRPRWIPVNMSVSGNCWAHYGASALDDLVRAHPRLFPGSRPSSGRIEHAPWRRRGRYTDSWGCVWETNTDGITGAVVERALPDWEGLKNFVAPDPALHNGWGEVRWDEVAAGVRRSQERGQIGTAGLRHGHTFLTLEYMRGYQDLIFDMADESPDLARLIDIVGDFNYAIVERILAMGPDIVGFPEDLGAQQGPLLSPTLFRRYIKASYQRLMGPIRHAGILVHMHSDGHVMALVEDLIDVGVDIINLQDLVNGIDEIARVIKGRLAINLDVDRQNVTVNGTPSDVDELVREEVSKLDTDQGGLSFTYGLTPPTPIENARALFDAFEKYCLERMPV